MRDGKLDDEEIAAIKLPTEKKNGGKAGKGGKAGAKPLRPTRPRNRIRQPVSRREARLTEHSHGTGFAQRDVSAASSWLR